jgi:hypothetical protein
LAVLSSAWLNFGAGGFAPAGAAGGAVVRGVVPVDGGVVPGDGGLVAPVRGDAVVRGVVPAGGGAVVFGGAVLGGAVLVLPGAATGGVAGPRGGVPPPLADPGRGGRGWSSTGSPGPGGMRLGWWCAVVEVCLGSACFAGSTRCG